MYSNSSAKVDLRVQNNGTWQDAFQFGDPTDLSWTLVGQHFIMEVKASRDDVTPLLTLQTANNTIIVDDVNQRVVHFNVPDTILAPALPPADYVYDLIMFDSSTPPIRVPLMHGKVYVRQGVTGA